MKRRIVFELAAHLIFGVCHPVRGIHHLFNRGLLRHMKIFLSVVLVLLLANPTRSASIFDGTIKVGVPLAGGKWANFSQEFMMAFHMVNAHVRDTGGIPIGGKRYVFDFVTYNLGDEVCRSRPAWNSG